ncbi:MAG: hypothetical protein M5U34_04850 [Chloroflexi bacterium]|nr:hypothetical protein [Chloroflexota bacterium]
MSPFSNWMVAWETPALSNAAVSVSPPVLARHRKEDTQPDTIPGLAGFEGVNRHSFAVLRPQLIRPEQAEEEQGKREELFSRHEVSLR